MVVGGSADIFRIPEQLMFRQQGGAGLHEAAATEATRMRDYLEAMQKSDEPVDGTHLDTEMDRTHSTTRSNIWQRIKTFVWKKKEKKTSKFVATSLFSLT